MKLKIFFMFILVAILQKGMSQKSFIDILSGFNQTEAPDKMIYSFVVNNIGFNPDSSFLLQKNDFMKRDYKFILIHKDSSFSFWVMFENQKDTLMYENLCLPVHEVLLFDKINKKLFYIEYNKSSSDCSFVFDKDLNIKCAMPHFESWISKIIELDSKFCPLFGFYTSWDLGYSIGPVSAFYYKNETWYLKIFKLNSKYEKVPYEYFINLNNIDFQYIKLDKCERDTYFPDFFSDRKSK